MLEANKLKIHSFYFLLDVNYFISESVVCLTTIAVINTLLLC